MDSRHGFYWILFIIWIVVEVAGSNNTHSKSNESHLSTKCNEINKDILSLNRIRREAPPEYAFIKHKSRPSKRYPGHRTRRRPKPVYGPPSFSYGSPISDYTLGYASNGRKNKKGQTPPSAFSSSILDSKYESDFSSPLKISLYSGHNSYESSFKNGNLYSSSASLPTFPLQNYESDSTSTYTVPPSPSYSNQGYKSFAEPPQVLKSYDTIGSEPYATSQIVKTIPPSTNYGIPVAPIQTTYMSQAQKPQVSFETPKSNVQPQETYNLQGSFNTPTISQSQQYYNLQSQQQPTYSNSAIYNPAAYNPSIYTHPTVNTNAVIYKSPPVNTNPAINTASMDPAITNLLSKFNQNALNTLTFNSYAPPQPPQVKYAPGSVTITGSKELTPNGKPSNGKFAEPPSNYKNAYRTSVSSYEAPLHHDSSKTTYNIDGPENEFEPTIYKPPQYFWNESRSTTTENQNNLPPTLPSSYDQNQFNTFSKQTQYSNYNDPESDFINSDGDYSSLFDVSHESKKIPKTKLTKTYAGTNLKSEDSSVESVEIPSDEYVDELISASTTKKPRTRRRRPKPTTASTTPHVLDTDDLRDAFSSGSVRYSLSVSPKSEAAKQRSQIARDKNFVLLSSANTNRTAKKPISSRHQPSFDPINDVREFLESDVSSEKNNSSNRQGIEILSIQQSKSHSYYAGTVAPPQLFKQNGITARYDQPKYDDSMFNVVSTNVRMANKGNSNLKWTTGSTGSYRTKKQHFDENDEVEDVTTKDPVYWNGKQLPGNHKLAKRFG